MPPRSCVPLSATALVLPALKLCLWIWGVAALEAWCAAVAGTLLLCATFAACAAIRTVRLRRRLCAETILYAAKWRAAFGLPAFDIYEAIAMEAFRRSGDHAALSAYIAQADALAKAAQRVTRGS